MFIDDKPSAGLTMGRIDLWACRPVGRIFPRTCHGPYGNVCRRSKSKEVGLLMVTVHDQNNFPFGAGLISLAQSGTASIGTILYSIIDT